MTLQYNNISQYNNGCDITEEVTHHMLSHAIELTHQLRSYSIITEHPKEAPRVMHTWQQEVRGSRPSKAGRAAYKAKCLNLSLIQSWSLLSAAFSFAIFAQFRRSCISGRPRFISVAVSGASHGRFAARRRPSADCHPPARHHPLEDAKVPKSNYRAFLDLPLSMNCLFRRSDSACMIDLQV